MAHDINSALERLEKNLTDLDSARSQVLKTVNASNDLLQMVTLYVSSIKGLATNLNEWEESINGRGSVLHNEIESSISNINQLCTDVISSFTKDVGKATNDFKEKNGFVIQELKEQNGILAERIEYLNALRNQIEKTTDEIGSVKSSLEAISKNLKDSQDEQDKALDEIKTMTSKLPSSIQNGTNTVLSAISQSEQVHTDLLTQTNSKIVSVNGKIDALAANVANLASIMNGSKDEILKSIKLSQDMTSRTTNLTRWIIIIGFIISFILQIVCIVK